MSEVAATSAQIKDAFISYASPDRAWALWTAHQLRSAGYSTILQHLDFGPGQNFVQRMHAATEQTRRTIAIFSPAYFASRWTAPEWEAVWVKDPQGEKSLLIPIRVRKCDPPGLLRPISYIDLVGQDEEGARRTLLESLQRAGIVGTADPQAEGDPPPFPEAASTTQAVAAGLQATEPIQEGFGIIVRCPETVHGLRPGKIRLQFPASLDQAVVHLAFDSKAFLVAGRGQTTSGPEFRYRFDAKGSRSRSIEIRSKRADKANHALLVLCMGPGGEMLLQEHFIICVKPRGVGAWPFAAAGVLAILAGGAAWWWNPDLKVRVNQLLFEPNYLQGKPDGWMELFATGATQESKWRCAAPACTESRGEPPDCGLTIGAGGLAIPALEFSRNVLYDFKYRFFLTLRDANEAAWLVRAQGHRNPGGYLFVFKRWIERGRTMFGLSGLHCPDLATCEKRIRGRNHVGMLLKGGTGSLGSNRCEAAGNSEIEINGTVEGTSLTVRATVHRRGEPDSEEECERNQYLTDQILYDDRQPWLWGGFGFFGFQQVGEFHIREFQVYR
jgi:hypothetical protein